MPLLDYNYNYNYNYAAGAGRGGGPGRVRFDTDVFSRLVTTTPVPPNFVVPAPRTTPVPAPPPAPPVIATGANYPSFSQYWDADLQARMYLDDFLANTAGWQANYATVAT